MPSNATVVLTPGSLPVGFCPATWQELYNKMFQLATGQLPGNYSTFNFGDSTPDVADQDKPWIRTIGGAPDRVYVFNSGVWMCPHPVPQSSDSRVIWVGDLTDLITYDGGAVGAVTDTTGPMWEEDEDFRGRSPLGVGSLSPSATAITLGQAYGTDVHTMTQAELVPHSHAAAAAGSAGIWEGSATSRFADNSTTGWGASLAASTGSAGGTAGAAVPFNITHPVRGCYIIKRTARKYYTV